MALMNFEEARERLLRSVPRMTAERCDVPRSVGRVLAEDLCTRGAIPAFDYSAMDGYAVRTQDLAAALPRVLRLQGESRTGGAMPQSVESGTTCRIFTGAPLPPGADAVVMQEDVECLADGVRFSNRVESYQHVRRAGEDLAAGDVALQAGTRIYPHTLALIATLERSRVAVARRPVVAIVSTGDELRDLGEDPRAGSIVDSNGPALMALAESCGALARLHPFARDDLDDTVRCLSAAMQSADVLITVGGVSVGDHDVVRSALDACGIELDFWKVAIKPGKPIAVGRKDSLRYLGLPGNPASAVLTFMLFGAPLLRAMQGDRAPLPALMRATLAAPVRHKPGRLEFCRASLEVGPTGACATVLRNQASGAVHTLAWADGFVLVPADCDELAAGDEVAFLRVRDV